jgi:hypothetical protein
MENKKKGESMCGRIPAAKEYQHRRPNGEEEERNNGTTSNNLNTTNTAAGADGWVGEATNGEGREGG